MKRILAILVVAGTALTAPPSTIALEIDAGAPLCQSEFSLIMWQRHSNRHTLERQKKCTTMPQSSEVTVLGKGKKDRVKVMISDSFGINSVSGWTHTKYLH
jgi:hypothetical protein